MSSGFHVKCPQAGCDWYGEAFEVTEMETRNPLTPNVSLVIVECPQCQSRWQVRVIGSDAESLPLVWDSEPVAWPPQDLGGGD